MSVFDFVQRHVDAINHSMRNVESEKIYCLLYLLIESKGKIFYGPTKNELSYLRFRRSIYANMKIKKGTKLSKKNIVTKRPSIGIGSEYFFKILGKKIKKNKKKFDPIYSNDF